MTARTVLRIGFAEAIAYRAELFVWLLATNMPLVMWLLWSTVAAEGPVGRYGPDQFAAYFLITLIVRLSTGAWVGWQMNDEVRRGVLQQRLLRPYAVFKTYALENIGAMPLRFAMMTPVFIFIALYVPFKELSQSPLQWAIAPLTVIAAWAVNFAAMLVIGTLSLYWQNSMAIFDVWLGGYFVFAGYLVPLELFPQWLRDAIAWMPYPYMLALPVETVLGHKTVAESLQGLGIQMLWIAGFMLIASLIWSRGLKRYEAFGG